MCKSRAKLLNRQQLLKLLNILNKKNESVFYKPAVTNRVPEDHPSTLSLNRGLFNDRRSGINIKKFRKCFNITKRLGKKTASRM